MTSQSSRSDPNHRRFFLSNPGSMIWTTTTSSSYGLSNPSSSSSNSANSPTSTSSSITPLINMDNNSTTSRIISSHHHYNHHHHHHPSQSHHQSGFNHFKTTGRRNQPTTSNVGSYSSQLINLTTTTTMSNNQQMMAARDRKPLTPEYEVPSIILDSQTSQQRPLIHHNHQSSHHQTSSTMGGGHFERNLRNHFNVKQPNVPQQQSSSNASHFQQQQTQLSNMAPDMIGSNSNSTNSINSYNNSIQHQLNQPHPSSRNMRHQPHLQQHIVHSRMSSFDDNNVINVNGTDGMMMTDNSVNEIDNDKSNMSESHIYSHIYDPTSSSTSTCCCVACDRLSPITDPNHAMITAGHHHQHVHNQINPSSYLTHNHRSSSSTGFYPTFNIPMSSTISTIFRPNGAFSPPYHTPEKKSCHDFKLSFRERQERNKLFAMITLVLLIVTFTTVLIVAFVRNGQKPTVTIDPTPSIPPFLSLDPSNLPPISMFNPRALYPSQPSPPSDDSSQFKNIINYHSESPSLPSMAPSVIPPSIAPSVAKVTVSDASIDSVQSPQTQSTSSTPLPSLNPKLSPMSPPLPTAIEHIEEEMCSDDEWKCHDGQCIPREKRCDGHFNCYDHSDEYNCDPCPIEQGYFHCGNETSCLDSSKRCNGIYDCWDGSDEHSCVSSCDEETEFLCATSGKCIGKHLFCDGNRDCLDSSDEPEGCSALTAPGAPVIV